MNNISTHVLVTTNVLSLIVVAFQKMTAVAWQLAPISCHRVTLQSCFNLNDKAINLKSFSKDISNNKLRVKSISRRAKRDPYINCYDLCAQALFFHMYPRNE